MRDESWKERKEKASMGYSILRYGRPMLIDIEDLEEAKKEALRFVSPVTGSEFIEIRDSVNETATIGYFDGRRFHWSSRLRLGRVVGL